jgi:hypothetical protein
LKSLKIEGLGNYLSKIGMNSTAVGVKGSDVYSGYGVKSPLVVAYTKAVRGASYEDINKWQDLILSTGANKAYEHAAVLAFQTRDIRGGKGEREAFYKMFKNLWSYDVDLVASLMKLVPEYGGWMDIMHFKSDAMTPTVLQMTMNQMILDQLLEDTAALHSGKITELSLLAKWLPREGNKYDSMAKELALYIWEKDPPGRIASNYMSSYRKRVSALNRALKTVEVLECANRWDEIDPKMVPGRAREIKMAAYLNETKYKTLRHPGNPGRMACRANFKSFFERAARGDVKINGADSIYPHELVRKILEYSSPDEINARNALWDLMLERVRALGGLGSSVAMCDFSGSMRGLPYDVSMAMGLMIASLNTGPFKNKFMSFDSTPQWHTIPEGASLREAIYSIGDNLGQGLSTDFQKAMDLILVTLKAAHVKPGDEPKNLIVITDMGFDKACSSDETSDYTGNSYRNVVKTAPWQTHIQMIRESFKRAGEEMWGASGAWTPPTIVIWNVSSSYTDDFHAKGNEEGVMMLSGWSPSLFKVLCEKGPQKITPEDAVQFQLDDIRYDPVRKVVAEWVGSGWRNL